MKNFFLNKKINAFTLIELIVVIAIIGILASVIYPSFVNYQKKAQETKKINDMKLIRNMLEIYYIEKGKYPDIDNDGPYISYDQGNANCPFLSNLNINGFNPPEDLTFKPTGVICDTTKIEGYIYFKNTYEDFPGSQTKNKNKIFLGFGFESDASKDVSRSDSPCKNNTSFLSIPGYINLYKRYIWLDCWVEK